ncbi:RanBP1 domain protein [Diplocarpon rosae]|nr:RanBP1 domain protein [Diplocarpon rosae]
MEFLALRSLTAARLETFAPSFEYFSASLVARPTRITNIESSVEVKIGFESDKMDTPQRANAAQMAARQLKAKPKGRLQNSRQNTAIGSRPDSSVQFAAVAQNGGGLFGGSIQGAGTFNFSAPGGLSMPTPSFPSFGSNASSSSDVSVGEGRFAGDDRATKRQFGGSSTTQPSQPTFQASNVFGQSQPSPFGAAPQPTPPSGNMFSFGGSTPTPGTNFSQGMAPANNPFSFGGASQPATASPVVSFGSGPTDSKPASSPFNFGQQAAQTSASNSAFTFGSSASQEKQAQAPSGIFNFGSTAQQGKSAMQPQVSSNSPFNFGSSTAQEIPTAQAHASFNSPFKFGSTATKEASVAQSPASSNSPFKFTSSATPDAPSAQPQNSSFKFGATATQEKPQASSNSLFNFGLTTVQDTPSAQSQNSSFKFGSTTTQEKPSAQSQASSESLFKIGPTATQEKPAASLFTFNSHNTATTSRSSLNFGSAPGIPSSSLFKSSAEAQPMTTFAPSNQQIAPANDIFGKTNAGSAATQDLFKNRSQSPVAPAAASPFSSNLFGSQDQSQAPAKTDFFGTSSRASPTPNIPQGQQNVVSTSTNIFSGPKEPATASNLFNSPKPQPPALTNLFGSSVQASPVKTDLLGTMDKPVDELAKDTTINGSSLNGDDTPKVGSSTVFSKTDTSTSLFDQPKPSGNTSSNALKPTFAFGSTSSSIQPTTSTNIFSSAKKVAAPVDTTKTTSSELVPSITEATGSPPKAIQQPNMVNDDSLILDVFNITDDQINAYLPAGLDEFSRVRYYTQFRLKSMNTGLAELFSSIDQNSDPSNALARYIAARKKIVDDWREYEEKHKNSLTNGESPSKLPRQIALPASMQSTHSTIKRKLAEDEDQENENPSKRAKEQPGAVQASFSASFPAAPPTNGNLELNSQSTRVPSKVLQGSSSPMKPASAFSKDSPLTSTPSASKNKRKAEDELTKDTEHASPLRQIKTPRLNGTTVGSNTSNIFKNILDSPSKINNPTKPPEKKLAPLPESKDDNPRPNPFVNLPVPGSSAKSAASPPTAVARSSFTPTPSSLSNVFTAPASAGTDKGLAPNSSPATVKTFLPGSASTPSSSSLFSSAASGVKPPIFGTPNVNGLTQFAQKAADDKKKAEEKRENDKFEEDYDSDDGITPAEWRAKYRAARKIELEELDALAKKPGQGFKFNSASIGTSSKPTPVEKTTGVVQPSVFDPKPSSKGFGSTTAPEPFKKITDVIQSSTEPRKSMVDRFGSAPTPDSSEKTPNTDKLSQPLFQRFGNSVNPESSRLSGVSAESSNNPSRRSSPDLFGSGSVLHGTASSKPVDNFKNPFGHLSDSGRAKGNHMDDESAGEENDDDEENKDPSYKPSNDIASSPGTPAEETGVGIASTKKTNPFSGFGTSHIGSPLSSGPSTPSGGLFGRVGTKVGGVSAVDKEQSGNTTPTRSLFDMIPTDANGKPIKHFSTDEKENAQPSTSNVFNGTSSFFGNSLTKTPSTSVDKTWKPDSGIKFASGANGDSTPTLSVTAATPAKTGNSSDIFGGSPGPSATFSNLFGSNESKLGPAASPFSSSLFGGSSNAKSPATTSIGFSFGAPSATSSLQPSAAASATTSRATTPGAATDGDSAADGDPDAEHHEQLNLTAGGPGEEDEEVLHEVRAKAQKFEKAWVTKGLGFLRILKHKDTKATRMLLRADPTGTVIMNKSLVEQFKYESNAKTVKVLTAADDGKGLETWLLQVKTEDSAKKLAQILEENKRAP